MLGLWTSPASNPFGSGHHQATWRPVFFRLGARVRLFEASFFFFFGGGGLGEKGARNSDELGEKNVVEELDDTMVA